MKLIILSMLVATSLAVPASQSMTFQDDGSYRFYYETGAEGGSHSRTEVRHPDGSVIGKFSYQDPEGEMREVNYKADESGFVAQGDVGVQGAPKGQFPATLDEQPQEQNPSTADETTEKLSSEPTEEKSETQENATYQADSHQDEEDKDELQDLALEESAPDYPPEGFPPGFFLQKFQGLRRLPEPTKKTTPATTESPKEDKPVESETTKTTDDQTEPEEQPSISGGAKSVREPSSFAPLNPFHGLSPQEWASAMYHQPVYVFSYNQPDSYGYHYFF